MGTEIIIPLIVSSLISLYCAGWQVHHMDINNPTVNVIQKDTTTHIDVIKNKKPLTLDSIENVNEFTEKEI